MDNDISPQGYSSPQWTAAIEQRQYEEQKDRDEVLSQLPLLKQVLRRLEKEIAKTDSIKNAEIIAKQYGCDREAALIGLNIAHDKLETERRYIETRVKRAVK